MSINKNILGIILQKLNDEVIYQVISPVLIKFYHHKRYIRKFYFRCNDSLFLPTLYLTSLNFQHCGLFSINTLNLNTNDKIGYLRDICPQDYDNIRLLLLS